MFDKWWQPSARGLPETGTDSFLPFCSSPITWDSQGSVFRFTIIFPHNPEFWRVNVRQQGMVVIDKSWTLEEQEVTLKSFLDNNKDLSVGYRPGVEIRDRAYVEIFFRRNGGVFGVFVPVWVDEGLAWNAYRSQETKQVERNSRNPQVVS